VISTNTHARGVEGLGLCWDVSLKVFQANHVHQPRHALIAVQLQEDAADPVLLAWHLGTLEY